MLHGFSASKISQTIRAAPTRHRATRNRNTGENLHHRADAACRCVTKRAGACRTRENFSESIDMADERQQFQGNRSRGRRQVMDMGMVERSRRGRIGTTSSPEPCARLSDPRSQCGHFSGCFVRFSRSSTRMATATLPALGIWSNGFMTARRIPLRSPAPRKLPSKAPDLANRTESGVAAIPVLFDSGLH